jgi:DNA polymerase-3 subunit delta
MLTILQGENELSRQEALSDILEKSHMTLDLRALNTETHEGLLTLGELRQACSALPFLGDMRIVIYKDALAQAKGSLGDEIVAYLPDLPPTTHLIFVESHTLPQKHVVVAWTKKNSGKVETFTFPKKYRDLQQWLQKWVVERVSKYGGTIEQRAVALLVQNFDIRLRVLDQEIQKLILYCGAGNKITVEDVRVMVPYVLNADVIFDMVDALGQRNAQNAALFLHRLLDADEHPLSIFGMMVRQFRLLIQTRWLIDQRYTVPEITERLKLHPYVAQKLNSQARRFTPSQLRAAYALLLETDLAMKTSKLEDVTALDLLVAKLTRL